PEPDMGQDEDDCKNNISHGDQLSPPKLNISVTWKNPVRPISHSAATTAPSANPARLWAVCLNSIWSTSELYNTVCVPGTSSIRWLSISSSSGFGMVSSPSPTTLLIQPDLLSIPSKIPSAMVIAVPLGADRKSTRLNSSHVKISYAVFS